MNENKASRGSCAQLRGYALREAIALVCEKDVRSLIGESLS